MEVQMKTENINTTKYMPTQKRKGCREPIMSCLLELAIGSGFTFLIELDSTSKIGII
jgi:hypothetical protein